MTVSKQVHIELNHSSNVNILCTCITFNDLLAIRNLKIENKVSSCQATFRHYFKGNLIILSLSWFIHFEKKSNRK